MAGSKIQAELEKATDVKQGKKQDRQDYLSSIVDAVNALDDKAWGKLSDDAQEWCNTAAKAVKAEKTIKDFPDVGSVPKDDDDEEEAPKSKKKRPAADEDDDEEEKPAKKKKPAAEDDDEEEDKPAKKKKPAAEDDDDEEEKPKSKKRSRDADDDDEEEKPAKKKRAAAVDDDEEEKPAKKKRAAKDEDDEDDKPAKKKAGAVKASGGGGVKNKIKELIVEDPQIAVDDLVKKLGKGGATVSKVTVSNIRAEFRHTLKFLQENKVNVLKLEL